MKSFLIRTLVYSVLFLVLCFLIEKYIDTGLRRSNRNEIHVWNKIINGDINADILITGSSRAMRMIDPTILEKSLGLSAYNIGMEGARLQSQLSRWDSYLQYNTNPKYIIQTVDLMSMGHANTIFLKEQYLAFMGEDAVYKRISAIDNHLFLDRYFPLYKYHGYIDEAIEGAKLNIGLKSNAKYTMHKGFESKGREFSREFSQMQDTMTRSYLEHPKDLVKEGYSQIEYLIEDCKQRDIELFLVFTPQYKGLTDLQIQTDSLVVGFENLSKSDKVHFLNYVYEDYCSDTTYFYNAMHLNAKGADLFSTQLSEDIRKILSRD